MKKLLVVLGLLVLVPGLALAQGTYYVDYYANNLSAFDQNITAINVGKLGTPLTSPVGDICAKIYVFDNSQELVACCSGHLTPNEPGTAWVRRDLTSNTVTGVVPASGVIKVVITPKTSTCDPTAPITGADASLAQVFGTHKLVTGGATFITEEQGLPSSLSAAEAAFLPQACAFAQYLGSGFGICLRKVE